MYDVYEENRFLRKRVFQLQLQLDEEERKRNETLDLLIKGESMHSRMMLNAILDGCIPNCGDRLSLPVSSE